jgi:hypothetical protein
LPKSATGESGEVRVPVVRFVDEIDIETGIVLLQVVILKLLVLVPAIQEIQGKANDDGGKKISQEKQYRVHVTLRN